MYDLISYISTPQVLYIFSMFCFVAALILLEGMSYARNKNCITTATICAILSILIGAAGWVGFFVTISSYIHAGFAQ